MRFMTRLPRQALWARLFRDAAGLWVGEAACRFLNCKNCVLQFSGMHKQKVFRDLIGLLESVGKAVGELRRCGDWGGLGGGLCLLHIGCQVCCSDGRSENE